MQEKPDWRDFSISTWYPTFEHIALKAIIIDIPKCALKQYLDDPDDYWSSDDAGTAAEVRPQKEIIVDYLEKVENAFDTLNNNVFIKNNWHAPVDAKMFACGYNLRATHFEDVRMFFSFSNIIQVDFCVTRGVKFCLVLKKYINIHPAAEFRCIVINKVLRGITPRDFPTYYAHFNEEGQEIIEKLSKFFNDNIKAQFPRENYVFDVVLSKADEPFLLDFGPLNNRTTLYAFLWQEIMPLISKDTPEEVDEVSPVFRYLETDIGIVSKSGALQKLSIQT